MRFTIVAESVLADCHVAPMAQPQRDEMTRLTLLLTTFSSLFLLACSGPSSGGATLLPQCTNGVADPNEGGVDCGGPCPVCVIATCSNGQTDAGESDIDCGGACADCGDGKACNTAGDCSSGNCAGGFCGAPAACDDGEKNGSETDLDCGGNCAGCGAGRLCGTASDCLSDVCTGGVCDEPASCSDGIKSPDESDIDCGGPCRACATGRFCEVDPDCLSAVCTNGVCRDPSCTDGRKNQDETDIDCGGICGPCGDGLRCGDGGDCVSETCASGRCVSCTDGVKNGDESGVDCGGSCGPCQDGGSCSNDNDCATGKCDRGFCCVPNACGACAALPTEVCDGVDNDCDAATDEPGDIGVGPACEKNTGVCVGARATCRGEQGFTCVDSDYRAISNQYEANESRCDGLDNDCDGQTDEGVTNACGTCGSAPAEVCDRLDNDCDGQTDEGVSNACGGCGAVPVELCNDKDDDCDGQTDEIAACAGCMDEPELYYSSTGDDVPTLNPGSFALVGDQNPVVAIDNGGSFQLERFGANASALTGYISGSSPQLVRVGNDLIVVFRDNQWTAQRYNSNGALQQTWSNLLPASYLVESLYSSGAEALLVSSNSAFVEGGNDWAFKERRLNNGTWSATADIDSGWIRGLGVLSGTTPVRLYLWEGADIVLKSKWGAAAATTVLTTSNTGFVAATASDGKVHLVVELPLQHWVGTSAGWTRTNIQGEAPFATAHGLAFMPTGEPVVLLSDSGSVSLARLANNRWTTVVVAESEVDQSIFQAAFSIDSYGRIHLAYSGVGSFGIENTWMRGITLCPSF